MISRSLCCLLTIRWSPDHCAVYWPSDDLRITLPFTDHQMISRSLCCLLTIRWSPDHSAVYWPSDDLQITVLFTDHQMISISLCRLLTIRWSPYHSAVYWPSDDLQITLLFTDHQMISRSLCCLLTIRWSPYHSAVYWPSDDLPCIGDVKGTIMLFLVHIKFVSSLLTCRYYTPLSSFDMNHFNLHFYFLENIFVFYTLITSIEMIWINEASLSVMLTLPHWTFSQQCCWRFKSSVMWCGVGV